MNSGTNDVAVLVGRILLALIFVSSGVSKIGGFDGTVGYIASKGLPMPQVVAALTILLEIGAGLGIVFGWFTRWSAIALALFTALAALLFHDFWNSPAAEVMTQRNAFMKNISIVGGLIVLAAFGPGGLSMDARRRAPAERR